MSDGSAMLASVTVPLTLSGDQRVTLPGVTPLRSVFTVSKAVALADVSSAAEARDRCSRW
jgi:hypothetical protein